MSVLFNKGLMVQLTFTDNDSPKVIVQHGKQEVQVLPFEFGQLDLGSLVSALKVLSHSAMLVAGTNFQRCIIVSSVQKPKRDPSGDQVSRPVTYLSRLTNMGSTSRARSTMAKWC